MITKKGPDGTYQLISVKRDSSGRAYFNDWTNSGSVTITNSQIKHILVVNRNIWVNSQKEKRKIINRFNFYQGMAVIAEGAILLAGAMIAFKNQ